MPKKNNHTYKKVFTQFNNLSISMELQGYYYYQERIQSTTSLAATIFSLYMKHSNFTTLKNPNYKRQFHNGLNWSISPSLRSMYQVLVNLPLKNYAILFESDCQTGLNKTRLQKVQHPTLNSSPSPWQNPRRRLYGISNDWKCQFLCYLGYYIIGP